MVKRGFRSFKDYSNSWIERKCPECGIIYWVRKRRLEKNRNLTCSQICGNAVAIRNPEVRKHMIEALIRGYKDGTRKSPFQNKEIGNKFRAKINQKERIQKSIVALKEKNKYGQYSRDCKELMKKRWKDPKRIDSCSKKMKAKWKEEGYAKKTLEAIRKGAKICNTDIEIVMKKKLDEKGIKYEYQKPTGFKWRNGKIIFFIPDFIIEDKKIIIECDGEYWHYNPLTNKKPPCRIQRKNIRKDALKKLIYPNNGYKLYSFWGSDIKKDNFNLEQRIPELFY